MGVLRKLHKGGGGRGYPSARSQFLFVIIILHKCVIVIYIFNDIQTLNTLKKLYICYVNYTCNPHRPPPPPPIFFFGRRSMPGARK